MEEHIHKQYQRYELAWYDLYHAGKITERIIEQELYDDARIKRSTERLALHTALVVTYARPFTEAKGFVALPSGVLKALDSDQRELHRAITDLRDQVYAHTDSDHFSVESEITEDGVQAVTSSPRLLHFGMPAEALEDLLTVIQALKQEVKRRQEELENKLQQ